MKLAMFLLLALRLPAADSSGAVVLQPVVNMYSKPASDADVVSQAIYGANVGVLEQTDGWARIRTADEYTGWTPLAGLHAGQTYAAPARWPRWQSLFAHIYREASVTATRPC